MTLWEKIMKWKLAKLIVWDTKTEIYHIENHYRSAASVKFTRIFEMDISRLIEQKKPYTIIAFELINDGHVVLYTEI